DLFKAALDRFGWIGLQTAGGPWGRSRRGALSMSHRRLPRTLLASLTIVFAIFTAGCGRHAEPSPSPSPALPPTSATPTPTASVDPQQAERVAVAQAYREFWLVSWPVDRQPPERW